MASLLIQMTKFGRGVFTQEPIPQGAIVEVCPVLIFPNGKIEASVAHPPKLQSLRDSHAAVNLQLSRYTFQWTTSLKALALGFGSLYNHSFKEANIRPLPSYPEQTISFIATRDIAPGEELLFNYHYDPTYHAKHNKIEAQIHQIQSQEENWAHQRVQKDEARYLQNQRELKEAKIARTTGNSESA